MASASSPIRLSHLRHILDEYLAYDHWARLHPGLDNVPTDCHARRDAQEEGLLADILCAERLGGLRKHSRRAA